MAPTGVLRSGGAENTPANLIGVMPAKGVERRWFHAH
jgi:hypothetical protein